MMYWCPKKLHTLTETSRWRKNGHRQLYSLIKIKKIFSKDGSILEEAKKEVKKVEKKETKIKVDKKETKTKVK